MRITNKLPHTEVNVSQTSPAFDMLKNLLSILLLLIILYFSLIFVTNLMLPYLPHSLEVKLGNLVYKSSPQNAEEKKLQELTDRLIATIPEFPYAVTVHIEPSADVNAFAIVGGRIVVYAGLLKQSASEAELAFVLAHELGHLAGRDHIQGMARALVGVLFSSLFSDDAGQIVSQTLNLHQKKLSREQELEADRFGLDIIYGIYGNVQGALDFFSKHKEKETLASWSQYLSTHPATQARIAAIEAYQKQKNKDQ